VSLPSGVRVTRFAGLAGALAVWLVVARTWASDTPPEPMVGSVLPGVPASLPPVPFPPPTLDRIRSHLEAGDSARALDTAERLIAAGTHGRERDSAFMVVGLLQREAGRHNLASEAFTQVRAGKGPLAPIAAFYEAEQDLLRGRPAAAIQECRAILAAAPDTDEADDCGRIVTLAHATSGDAGAARAAAAEYDAEHEHGPIAEQVEVRLAHRWTISRPELAASLWRQLALHHEAPLTGRIAEEQLARLAAAGVAGAVLPDDPSSRMTRAVSMRDSGRLAEAWALFEKLEAAAATDPVIARWVLENQDRFGWRTRHWDALAAQYLTQYNNQKTSGIAWNRYKVLVRAGRFGEASDWALQMQKAHGRGTAFFRAEEEIGRTMMLAGRYPEAITQFDAVAGRGGWSGRRAAALAAFASHAGGNAEDAVRRYGPVVAADEDNLEARYWRSRALSVLGRSDEAAADRAFVLQTDPWSWYATLLRQDDPGRPGQEPFARDGTWPGRPLPPPPPLAVLDLPTTTAFDSSTFDPRTLHPARARQVEGDLHLAVLSWPWARPAPPPGAVLPWQRSHDRPEEHLLDVPLGYRASSVFDPDRAREEFTAFSRGNAASFPELAGIADLAAVGLYEEAGTRLSVFYRDLRQRSSRGDRAARRLLEAGGDRWRTFFLVTHDHHDSARSLYDTWDEVQDPTVAGELQRLGFPLAHGRYVWTHGRAHGVDPMLVLGLMRQESTYNARAVSRAGARGPMQIMPRTGHLLADLARNEEFNAGDLSDPDLAVEYGIWYLGLLLERFDGVYPLAVAAYNGGPHNMSSWLQGPARDLPMDQLVEHIPFRETRDYVKRVSEGYATYVDLYAPSGSVVSVPTRVRGDDPTVVDF